LTHDEHEILASLHGERLPQASRHKTFASLSSQLRKELDLYSRKHPELNIHVRPSDKLYDILKIQVQDGKGWFHLIHQPHQKQKEAIQEVEWAAEQRLNKALAEQETRLKREHEKLSNAFVAFDRQVLRGG
jgi:hypothetical protein